MTTDDCCTSPRRPARPAPCPVSGFQSKPVPWLTVAALTRDAVPPKQPLWLCRDTGCELVFFGQDSALTVADLNVAPGFKTRSDGLVCYCFQHRRSDLEHDLATGRETTTMDAVRAQVRAGNCACEVRNPTGACCLGDLQRTLADLRRQRHDASPPPTGGRPGAHT